MQIVDYCKGFDVCCVRRKRWVLTVSKKAGLWWFVKVLQFLQIMTKFRWGHTGQCQSCASKFHSHIICKVSCYTPSLNRVLCFCGTAYCYCVVKWASPLPLFLWTESLSNRLVWWLGPKLSEWPVWWFSLVHYHHDELMGAHWLCVCVDVDVSMC